MLLLTDYYNIETANDATLRQMFINESIIDPFTEEFDDDPEHIVTETIKKKYIVRHGKKVLKYYTDKPGYKVINGKEVKVTAKEKTERKKTLKKALIKRRKTLKTGKSARSRSAKKSRKLTQHKKKSTGL
jgi:hypothetical protein